MGGKSGAKQQVTQYYMAAHYGVCLTVENVRRISYGQKTMVDLYAPNNVVANVNSPGLFGGDKKEGGVSGRVHVLLGGADQVLSAELAAMLGLSPEDAPAYRGITTLFFTGYNGDGFNWTANTPYLRDIWVTVDRYPRQLDPGTALVPRLIPGSVPANSSGWEYQQLPYHADPGHTNLIPPVTGWHSGGTGPFEDDNLWTRVPDLSVFWIRKTVSIAGYGLTLKAAADNGCVLFVDGVLIGKSNPDNLPIPGNQNYPVEFPVQQGHAYEIVVKAYSEADSKDQQGNYLSVSIEGQGAYDANPAHIIYECLTDTEWGMGESPDNIDIESFQKAAQTLYDEGFGVSMMWSAESTIEDFVNEVLNHANGVLFTNPRTGLFTLKLTRGDYDPDNLRVITPDNGTMTAFSRKAWGETVNEVRVTWTNPDNEEQETVTLQDNGNIAMQGAVVSSSSNYYGIRSSYLAMIVCARDLRASSAPLCAAEMLLDRSEWDLEPMQVVKVTWPEYGLNELIMRVTNIDYGEIGEGLITVSMVEDIFSLPTIAFTAPPSSSWPDPVSPPIPVATAMVIPSPYFGLSGATGSDESAIQDPDTYLTVVAAKPSPGASSYDVLTQTTAPNGDLQWTAAEYGRPFMGYATLEGPLAAEPITLLRSFALPPGQTTAPAVNDVCIIGGPDTPPEELELALVARIDTNYDAYVLWRAALDTVPREWPAGTPIWFGPAEAVSADPTKRLALSTAKYRLLTSTLGGQLNVDDAPDLAATAKARPSKPLRPADLRAKGVRNEIVIASGDHPTLDVTWATRNRLVEDAQVLTWTDSPVSPEAGATVTINIEDVETGATLNTYSGLTGTSYSVALSSYFTGDPLAVIKQGIRLSFSAARNGETSWTAGDIVALPGRSIPVPNAGAEAGNTSSWTVTPAGAVVSSTTQFHTGTRSFVGSLSGGAQIGWLTQDLPIPDDFKLAANTASMMVTPTAWAYNYQRSKNYSDIGVAVVDVDGVWRGGRMVRFDDYPTRWQAAMASMNVPYDAQTFRLVSRLRLRSSTDSCYVDDFEVTNRLDEAACYDIYAHTATPANGWSASGVTLGAATSAGDAGWGLPALTAVVTDSNGAGSFTRDVVIQAGAVEGIDLGKASVRYTAALSSITGAGARLKINFLDGVGAVLDSAYSRAEATWTTLGEFEYDTIETAVPVGTRTLRIGADVTKTTPSSDVAATFNWITAHLLDASGNQYVDRNIRVTEDGEDRITEDGEVRILDSNATSDRDIYWDKVVSLVYFNGTNGSTTFPDEKGNTWARFGNSVISSAQAKFGSTSLYLDGNGDFLRCDAISAALAGKDTFTLEMWVYLISPLPSDLGNFLTFNTSTGDNRLLWEGRWLYMNGANRVTYTIPTDQWVHVALVADHGTYSVFVGGIAQGSYAYGSGIIQATDSCTLGQEYDFSTPSGFLKGYVSNMRVTRDVARYKSNFAPPFQSFPNS